MMRYIIKGRSVCKDFFRRATGFEKRMFNNVHSLVARGCSTVDEENDLKKLSQSLSTRDDNIENVVGFLDSYFKTETFGVGNVLVN